MKEFGSVFVVSELDRGLGLGGLVDEVVPAKRKTLGPSVGELLFCAVLNRTIAPRSKRQLARWFERTDIQNFALQLARIPLKEFGILPGQNRAPEDQVVYVDTHAPFWGKERRVVITFNPRTFRKKRYDLKEKLTRLRQELYELRRKHHQGDPHWKKPDTVRAHYALRCASLHTKPEFFELTFYQANGRPTMAFQMNRYQVETQLRRFAKTILITDHKEWPPEEIVQAYMDRSIVEDQFRKTKSPFQVALMPQYHWTDSKIRIHVFVCIAALTYLTLLGQRLRQASLSISTKEAMEELRSLRRAIYWMPKERNPRRLLEEPNPTQIAILNALGFLAKDGRVLQAQ